MPCAGQRAGWEEEAKVRNKFFGPVQPAMQLGRANGLVRWADRV